MGDPRGRCVCPPHRIESYRSRISGPLLDRIDLHVEVPAVTLEDLRGPRGEGSATVAARVRNARARQRERFDSTCPTPFNAALDARGLQEACPLSSSAQGLLDRAFHHLGLSARALHRILKVARTLADLEGSEDIKPGHVAEAIQYRALDRRVE
ncbi:MAG: ATP-binding protein [Acidobacteriota bacterium]